tara:strand:- start:493 stop:789 length:297 start_codon:yes stop_codon:yes gene_type:complete
MINNIKENLTKNICCNHLEIIDESPNHGGYSGSVSHVKIVVISEDFEGLNLIKRHQLVYKALENLVSKIHAISIVSKTIDEWKKSPDFIPSPDCAKNK